MFKLVLEKAEEPESKLPTPAGSSIKKRAQEISPAPQLKHQFFGTQPSLVHISHPYMTTGKTIALTIWNFVGKLFAFYYALYICHSFYSKEQASFNFMAAVPICSDFGAPPE